MDYKKIKILEQALVGDLNEIGWVVSMSQDNVSSFDAIGINTEKKPCFLEFKFRNEYYPTKMLEVSKYRRILGLNKVFEKYYIVVDKKGVWIWDLKKIKLPEVQTINCNGKTLWNDSVKEKKVYLLEEQQELKLKEDARIYKLWDYSQN